MGVRRVAAVAGVTAAVLGGCSVPTSFGARLNYLLDDEDPWGEWVWIYTSDYPWVPDHPCDGVDLDDLTS